MFCFQDNWDILNFVPAHYFFFETHWAKGFFYETLVCFRGVAKPSFFDGFANCFSIEFLFTKIDSNKIMTHKTSTHKEPAHPNCFWPSLTSNFDRDTCFQSRKSSFFDGNFHRLRPNNIGDFTMVRARWWNRGTITREFRLGRAGYCLRRNLKLYSKFLLAIVQSWPTVKPSEKRSFLTLTQFFDTKTQFSGRIDGTIWFPLLFCIGIKPSF